MQCRGGLGRSTVSFDRESGRQLTGFGRETRTIPPSGGVLQAQVHRNRTLHRGNVNVPPSRPAIESSEDGGGRRAASGRKKGPSTTSSAPRALPGRKEPGQGVVASHGPCRGANHLATRARDWKVCTPPARSRGGTGKHGRQLWVRFGGGRDPRGGSPAESSSSEDDCPSPDAAIDI